MSRYEVRLLLDRQVGRLVLKKREGPPVKKESLAWWTIWTNLGEFVGEFRRKRDAVRYINKHGPYENNSRKFAFFT